MGNATLRAGLRPFAKAEESPPDAHGTRAHPRLYNHRRVRSDYGRALMKRRGATVELSFQHVYERGGQRQTYLRGHENNEKRNLIAVAAHNLGVLMRKLVGAGCPKACATLLSALQAILGALRGVISRSEAPHDGRSTVFSESRDDGNGLLRRRP